MCPAEGLFRAGVPCARSSLVLISAVLFVTGLTAFTPGAPAQPAPPSEASADMLARCKQAVFEVTILDEQGQPVSSGSGFLVGQGGLGITNFHVVRGAARAQAQLAGSTT